MEAQHPLHPRRNVRLDTLVRLRWLAAIGQTVAVLVVHYVFDFNLPLTACLLVIACSAALNLVLPLRWVSDEPLELPPIYLLGVWFSLLVALGVIGAYSWQIAEEARLLTDALAATELVLAREQHLSQLDGLAAAAAHELGTPLSTIAVVVRELERALEPTSPHSEDVKLLREQAQRCREILAKLTQLSASSEPFDRSKLSALIEEVVAPHRNFGVAIDVALPADRAAEPVGEHNPAIIYGLGNLVENAVDFARERVDVAARWSDGEVVIAIADDGPGFAPEILDRIGEPYLTRRSRPAGGEGEISGLGLGVFIAKTLLERTGAALTFANRAAPEHGASVRVRWRREDYERPGPGIPAAAP